MRKKERGGVTISILYKLVFPDPVKAGPILGGDLVVVVVVGQFLFSGASM